MKLSQKKQGLGGREEEINELIMGGMNEVQRKKMEQARLRLILGK